MKRALLIPFGFILAMCLLAFLGMVFSPRLRLVGVAGLGIVAILTIAWMLAMRRSRAATRLHTAQQRVSPGVADLDAATSLRTQPTWRDDANGRVGPKWQIGPTSAGIHGDREGGAQQAHRTERQEVCRTAASRPRLRLHDAFGAPWPTVHVGRVG